MIAEYVFQSLYEIEMETLRFQKKRVKLFENILKRSAHGSNYDRVMIDSATSNNYTASTTNDITINEVNNNNRPEKIGEAQHDVNAACNKRSYEESDVDNEDLSDKSRQKDTEEMNSSLDSNDSIYNKSTQLLENIVMEPIEMEKNIENIRPSENIHCNSDHDNDAEARSVPNAAIPVSSINVAKKVVDYSRVLQSIEKVKEYLHSNDLILHERTQSRCEGHSEHDKSKEDSLEKSICLENRIENISFSSYSDDYIYNKLRQHVENVIKDLDNPESNTRTLFTNPGSNSSLNVDKELGSSKSSHSNEKVRQNHDNSACDERVVRSHREDNSKYSADQENVLDKSVDKENETIEISGDSDSESSEKNIVTRICANPIPANSEFTASENNGVDAKSGQSSRSDLECDNTRRIKEKSNKDLGYARKLQFSPKAGHDLDSGCSILDKTTSREDILDACAYEEDILEEQVEKMNSKVRSDNYKFGKVLEKIIEEDLCSSPPLTNTELDIPEVLSPKSIKRQVAKSKSAPNTNSIITQVPEIQDPDFTRMEIEPIISEVNGENEKSCDNSSSILYPNQSKNPLENFASSTLLEGATHIDPNNVFKKKWGLRCVDTERLKTNFNVPKSEMNDSAESRKRVFNVDDDVNSKHETNDPNEKRDKIVKPKSGINNIRIDGNMSKALKTKRKRRRNKTITTFDHSENVGSILEKLRKDLGPTDYTSQEQTKPDETKETNAKCEYIKSLSGLIPKEPDSDEEFSNIFANLERCKREVESYKPKRCILIPEKPQMASIGVYKPDKNTVIPDTVLVKKPIKRNRTVNVNKQPLIHITQSEITISSNSPVKRYKNNELNVNRLADSENITTRALIHEFEINNNDLNKRKKNDLPSKNPPRKKRQQPSAANKKIDWNAIESFSEYEEKMKKS